MRKILFAFLLFTLVSPLCAQEKSNTSKGNINTTRQGFGDHRGLSLNVGFVNPQAQTDGSAYYFNTWDTEGVIYTKNEGALKIKEVNVNLYDNTLEALYDDNSVFTFNSDNIIKIIIDGKIFRFLEDDGDLRIFEIVFNKTHSVYKGHKVSYTEAAVNPMLIRNKNKYITKTQYYLYKNGDLEKIKLSRKAFSKLFQSEDFTADQISTYIKKAKLSLSDEQDLIKALSFITA